MTPQELKNSILQLAIQGKLVEQRPEEGTAEELYQQIQVEKQRLIAEGKIKKEKPLPEITEDEKPFDIPDSWKWVRIQDLFNVRSAMRIHQSDWQTSGIPFFRGRELVQLVNTGNADFEIFISRELYEQNKEKGGVPKKDDILISAVGTLGKVYVVQGTQEFYYKDAYILCLENMGKLYPGYIKKALESPFLQSEIRRDSMATTVAQLTIIKTKSLFIPLPPLAEQKRIVAKIEELLPLIDRYEKAWSRLEEFNKQFPGDLQKSILQMAIQGKLVEQRPEEGTGEKLYQQIQAEKQKLIAEGKIKKEKPLPEITEEEKPFDIPESWKWVRLFDVIEKNPANGFSPRGVEYQTEFKNLTLTATTSGYFIPEAFKYVDCDKEKASKYWLKHNDILIQRSNSRELVGTSCIYTGEDNVFIYPDLMMRIRVVSLVDVRFVDYVLKAPLTRYYYTSSATGSSESMPKINQAIVINTLIPLPPLAEQKRIVARLEELLPLCEALKS